MTSQERQTTDQGLDITLREVREDWEYQACVDLQKATWGDCPGEIIYRTTFIISQKVGGITAGAFDAENRLLGFVFGLTGVQNGRRLKLYQREWLLDMGVEIMQWTYDPLVARNAHFNLNRLGARINEYVINIYGETTGDILSKGIGTDRFIVEWRMAEEHAVNTIQGKREKAHRASVDVPILNTAMDKEGTLIPVDNSLDEHPAVRVEVPENILAIQNTSLDLAARWRANTRRVFTHYLHRGYGVDSFYREPDSQRCFYVLKKP
jgi:chorismate synthase